MEDNVVVHVLNVVVTDDARETDLMVGNEQSGVVPVDSLKLVCINWVGDRSLSAVAHSSTNVKSREPTL